MTKNPTILTLMRSGCTVSFPSGFFMRGEVASKDITVGFDIGDGQKNQGIWDMSRKGVLEALGDEYEFRKEMQRDNCR